jgi:hypothetical protein
MLGERFGRLVVIGQGPNQGKHLSWLCRCDCGNEKVILGISLRRGATRSCGCLSREKARERRLVEVPGYFAAHRRVSHERGAASSHLCIDCGDPATDWSYRGGAEKEFTQERSSSNGNMYTVPYSIEPDDYDPRCKHCHNIRDKTWKKPLDLSGQKFGHWTPRIIVGRHTDGLAVWLCVCCCGREGTATSGQLIRHHSRSCRQTHDSPCECEGKL